MRSDWLWRLVGVLGGVAAAQEAPLADLTRSGVDAEVVAVRVGEVEDQEVNESSGLTAGLREPALFWTHNDSGGRARLYAMEESGAARARVDLPRTLNLDWEDLAAGPDAEGRPALFVGDIGDNLRLRPAIQIYQIAEPAIGVGEAMVELESGAVKMWSGRYPEGPANAEGLLVHPKTGRIYVLTKEESGHCGLYAFPEVLVADECMMLERVARLVFPKVSHPGKRPQDNCMTTAAALSPDGRRLVVSTYCSLYEWELSDGKLTAEALAVMPRRILPPLTKQMEAVCYGGDSRTLYFTSEHLPTPLWRLERVAE